MSNIVYGVSGEGSGHSSRSKGMISHLEQSGHNVKVVSYDRGYKNLKDDFDVFEIEGLHIAGSDNKVSIVKTFTENLKKISIGNKKFQELRHEIFKNNPPDCVITDFEPTTAYLANHYDLPLITVDNQHRMRYMAYQCPPGLKNEQLLTENIIRGIVPKPDVSLITTFYFGQAKNKRTFFFPPILREEIVSQSPRGGEHILIYLTRGFESFLDQIRTFSREQFHIYGYDQEKVEGNLHFKTFSKDGFINDLSTCKAVMATAGFTLMTEAFYLRKPYLSLPMKGQFEQELNGFLLSLLDYGKNMRHIQRDTIASFLYHIPDYKKNLQKYKAADNSAIKMKLNELLENNCKQLILFHQNRYHLAH